jgi:hypothetical protein
MDVEAIACVRSLRRLDLSWTEIAGETLGCLEKVPGLEELDISFTGLADGVMPQIARLTHLKVLLVAGTGLAADNGQVLRQLRGRTEVVQ